MLVTSIVKVSDTDALLASVLVTVMLILPTWSLVGVPLRTPVEAVKVSQLGSSAPLSKVAVTVEVSLVSTSAKVAAGIVRLKLASSAVETSPSAMLKVGASLVLVVVRRKLSDAEVPMVSVLVTVISILPTSSFVGVPLRTPVAAVKVSQLGNSPPPVKVAVKVEVSPVSTSAKVALGIVKLKAESSAIV